MNKGETHIHTATYPNSYPLIQHSFLHRRSPRF